MSLQVSFGDLLSRRQGEFLGRQPPQGCVRTALVVLPPPRLDLAPRVGQRQEPVCVQALVAQAAIERLGQRIVGRLTAGGHRTARRRRSPSTNARSAGVR